MPISITPGAGATIAGRNDGQGEQQAILQSPVGRFAVAATYHLVASTMATLSVPATAQMALITLDPGAGMRWSAMPSTAGLPTGTLGNPLFAQGSYPEAVEIVGSAAEIVGRLCCPRGIGTLTALALTVELDRLDMKEPGPLRFVTKGILERLARILLTYEEVDRLRVA